MVGRGLQPRVGWQRGELFLSGSPAASALGAQIRECRGIPEANGPP